jgi:hypothetical protein
LAKGTYPQNAADEDNAHQFLQVFIPHGRIPNLSVFLSNIRLVVIQGSPFYTSRTTHQRNYLFHTPMKWRVAGGMGFATKIASPQLPFHSPPLV